MDFFKNIKRNVHNWTNNIVGNNEQMISVIEKTIVPVKSIVCLWQDDPAYIESLKDLNLFKGKFYKFNQIEIILQYFNSSFFKNKVEKFQNDGYDITIIYKVLIQKFLEMKNISIQEKDLLELIQLLIKYDYLMKVNYYIKRNIIVASFLKIYGQCLILNGIREKNREYASIIGNYVTLNEIIGYEGEFLKEGRETAIDYIWNMDDFLEQLESKKDTLELEINYYKK